MDTQSDNQPDAPSDQSVGHEDDPRYYTADAVLIRHGLRVWDNDLHSGTVWFTDRNPGGEHWDGWFHVINDANGYPELVNGERMATAHPFTRLPPPPVPADPDRDALAAVAQAGVSVRTGEEPGRAAVTFAPRVDGDPKPWVDGYHRRFTTSEVHASPADVDELRVYVRTMVPQVQALELSCKALGSVAEHVSMDMLRITYGERGQGHGDRVMALITQWADEHGVVLTVTPEPAHLDGERPTGLTRLRKLYRRHGFIRNSGRRPQYFDSMFREPRTQA